MRSGWEERLERMVREQIEARGVRDPKVLAAIRAVPRHRFVDASLEPDAYEDRPLPIGFEATISQPYMVAYMVERLDAAGRRVLEIGTGSGYETAVLAHLAAEIFTIEVEPELARRSRNLLQEMRIRNVRFRVGDGMLGWSEQAPFSRIILTAAVPEIPKALTDQLEMGGRLLAPVGPEIEQKLVRIVRTPLGLERVELMPVVFVPAHRAPFAPTPSTNGQGGAGSSS